MTRPGTLGELRASGWVSGPVKTEIRENALKRIAAGEPMVEGILGFDDTVMPQLENALLAMHDVILLGERGQAKTRIIRGLVALLDEWMPIVGGSEGFRRGINSDFNDEKLIQDLESGMPMSDAMIANAPKMFNFPAASTVAASHNVKISTFIIERALIRHPVDHRIREIKISINS